MSESAKTYHHGDLYVALVNAATARLEAHGIEGLSLRKLAEDVGVSRTAPYHHFKDKHALLSAIAAQGYAEWQKITQGIFEAPEVPAKQRMRQFIFEYVSYASAHPQMYDLMFGRTLWKSGNASKDLKDVAYPCFQYQVAMTKEWQRLGILPHDQDTLRLSQVTWATLHGLARLLIDGIYADASHLEEMCETAAGLFMQQASQD